ncbi:WW domain-binding protein 4 [Neosynchiropus ocellatus]
MAVKQRFPCNLMELERCCKEEWANLPKDRADYWKSQPRKFCQYCKCWIADNKPSIEFHERGKNHKENVAAKFNDIRKKSVNKAKQEAKMSKQFAAMEEAAHKAYEQDLKRMEMEASGIRLEAPTSSLQDVLPLVGKASQNKPQGQGRQQKQTNKKQKSGGPSFPGGPDAQFWVAGKSDDGNTYYYNTVTGESRWDEPHPRVPKSMPAQTEGTSASAWVEAVSPEGYTYYYNSQTGESIWEKPAYLASKDAVAPGRGKEDGAGETRAEAEKDKSSSEAVNDPEAAGAVGPGAQESTNLRKRKADNDAPEEDESISSALVRDEEKEGENQTEAEGKTDDMVVQARRRVNPYGAWERIKVEKTKTEKFVDLQLPKVQVEVAPPPPPDVHPEPKPKFKERIITSLGVEGGPVAFKKKQNGKSRSLRQRDADD